MNIIPTNYVQLPLGGTVNKLEISINPFSLFPTEITVIWRVTGENLSKEGTIVLPQSLIDQWGVDDTIVKNYVLQQLNLTEDLQ
jgi:hypothetical protein